MRTVPFRRSTQAQPAEGPPGPSEDNNDDDDNDDDQDKDNMCVCVSWWGVAKADVGECPMYVLSLCPDHQQHRSHHHHHHCHHNHWKKSWPLSKYLASFIYSYQSRQSETTELILYEMSTGHCPVLKNGDLYDLYVSQKNTAPKYAYDSFSV